MNVEPSPETNSCTEYYDAKFPPGCPADKGLALPRWLSDLHPSNKGLFVKQTGDQPDIESLKCNKFSYETSKTCLISSKKQQDKKKYPCQAICQVAMILQIEITPIEGEAADVAISAVSKRYNKILQPEYNRRSDHRNRPPFFGYNFTRKSGARVDYIGGPVEKLASLKLSTKNFTGVWLGWKDRTTGPTKNKGPFLQVRRTPMEML